MMLLAAFVSLLFLYSLVSRRLERTVVTAPIVFTIAGMLMGSIAPAVPGAAVHGDVFLRLAEIGLVLLLFTDASCTDLNVLRGIPLLDAAAIEAVKQWIYTPTLLNGVPVPVIMTVTVNFKLS